MVKNMPDYKKLSDIPDNMPRLGGRKPGGGPRRFMPTEKPQNAKGTFKRLMKIYAIQWKQLIFVMMLTILSTCATLAIPYLIGKAFDTFDIAFNAVNGRVLTIILAALLTAYIANWIVTTLNGWMMAGISQNLVRFMRRNLFGKLQKLPLKFYDARSHGDTMSRLTNDIDNISSTIAQTTTELVSSVLSITGSFVMMLILSPLLTPAAMITIPLVILLTKTIAGRSRRYFLGQQKALGELNGIIEESITGIKMVKAFNQEENILNNFEAVNKGLREYSTKAQVWSGFLMPLMNVINNLTFASVACVGGILCVKDIITVGVIASFITYSKQFGMPLNNIAGMFNTIQSALAGAERVFEVLDETEELKDKDTTKKLDAPKGMVEFKNVSFSYNDKAKVLDNISFTVKAGETVALVGETGAGKTTIVNLLTRFYDLDSGEIKIDKINIYDIKREELRKYFSVVLQDTCLFTGTIADNIRYGNRDATIEQVKEAAKLANADHFITRTPKGYDTMVSGSADNLSQGQRQLLAIARAVLCNTPILILDEATSSVDTRTEKSIQRAMLKLMQNRTSFLIAHRLSTIKDADKIMVIGEKKILECGTHTELMNLKGKYYRMVISQTGGVVIE